MTGLFIHLFAITACWNSGLENVVSIPQRSNQAVGGAAFIASTYQLGEPAREEAIFQQVAAGNIPDFLHQLKPITIQAKTKSGRQVSATYYVLSDYLAIGSSKDYVRIPMNPITAQRIANRLGMLLPTTKIVDDVYNHAQVKLSPAPLPPSSKMTTSPYFWKHNQLVQKQFARYTPGQLVAGHKKDVVISNRLSEKRGRVAIYGWHRTSGRPIQPLSLAHHDRYADYSHGVRLVAPQMKIGDTTYKVADVLRDPELAPILSKEGVIRDIKIRIPINTAGL